jgi:hypothetical protein
MRPAVQVVWQFLLTLAAASLFVLLWCLLPA